MNLARKLVALAVPASRRVLSEADLVEMWRRPAANDHLHAVRQIEDIAAPDAVDFFSAAFSLGEAGPAVLFALPIWAAASAYLENPQNYLNKKVLRCGETETETPRPFHPLFAPRASRTTELPSLNSDDRAKLTAYIKGWDDTDALTNELRLLELNGEGRDARAVWLRGRLLEIKTSLAKLASLPDAPDAASRPFRLEIRNIGVDGSAAKPAQSADDTKDKKDRKPRRNPERYRLPLPEVLTPLFLTGMQHHRIENIDGILVRPIGFNETAIIRDCRRDNCRPDTPLDGFLIFEGPRSVVVPVDIMRRVAQGRAVVSFQDPYGSGSWDVFPIRNLHPDYNPDPLSAMPRKRLNAYDSFGEIVAIGVQRVGSEGPPVELPWSDFWGYYNPMYFEPTKGPYRSLLPHLDQGWQMSAEKRRQMAAKLLDYLPILQASLEPQQVDALRILAIALADPRGIDVSADHRYRAVLMKFYAKIVLAGGKPAIRSLANRIADSLGKIPRIFDQDSVKPDAEVRLTDATMHAIFRQIAIVYDYFPVARDYDFTFPRHPGHSPYDESQDNDF